MYEELFKWQLIARGVALGYKQGKGVKDPFFPDLKCWNRSAVNALVDVVFVVTVVANFQLITAGMYDNSRTFSILGYTSLCSRS